MYISKYVSVLRASYLDVMLIQSLNNSVLHQKQVLNTGKSLISRITCVLRPLVLLLQLLIIKVDVTC